MFRQLCVMARCALCCILLGLCVTSSAQAVCNSDEKSSNQCGNLLYDIKKYTCCDRSVTQGPHLSCCGTTAYNKLDSSCCNNVVTVGLSQTVSSCCGSKAYNPLNQICCGGSIQDKTSAHTECCGSGLYDTKKQLCCKNQFVQLKETVNHVCCGNATLNTLKQCCCDTLEVENLDSACCKQKLERERASLPNASQPTTSSALLLKDNRQMDPEGSAYSETPHCGLQPYCPLKYICCSGKLFSKTSDVTQCCGEEPYKLSEEGVLCCDGQLYRGQPAGSLCSGNVPYSPHNCTVCQEHVHLPAGQQCCGQKTFNPHEEICCNGHRYSHKGKADMTCCGSHAYNASSGTHMCCSGHLHDLTNLKNKEEAECCGPVLLTNKKEQQCCHSAEKSLVYKTQPGHSCCGHWYYNMSMWSCCAGQLTSKPTHAKIGELKFIRPLLDFSKSAICKWPVLLGTVQSVAVKQNKRFVVLKEALEVNTTVKSCGNSLEVGPLDHCLFPVLELGRTYLWTKNKQSKYEPLADVTGLTTPLHTILSLCQHNRTCYTA
ncbi:usherin-like isoform X1 [Pygocentrus nattereri]|uniref:usherin-like isoform X1 n=1 Tax=Pygocentrus nattereri TaxID=42514 RepID=UPI0018914464|nr:usherin-like isoform X1 [Pygocentrus nattereri]